MIQGFKQITTTFMLFVVTVLASAALCTGYFYYCTLQQSLDANTHQISRQLFQQITSLLPYEDLTSITHKIAIEPIADSMRLYQKETRKELYVLPVSDDHKTRLFDASPVAIDIYQDGIYWATLEVSLDKAPYQAQFWRFMMLVLMAYTVLWIFSILAFFYRGRRVLKPFLRMVQHSNALLRKYDGGDFVSSAAQPLSSINHALSVLESQLDSSKSECIKLTNYIRESTFHDELTGLANRHYFQSRLNEVLKGKEDANSGVILLLEIKDFNELVRHLTLPLQQDVIQQTAIHLSSLITSIPDAVLARIDDEDFAMLIPQYTDKQAVILAKKILNKLPNMALPTQIDMHDFANIGIALFRPGMDTYQVMSEADMALRTAQLQGPNLSFIYAQGALDASDIKGSVRWRVMLDRIIDARAVKVFLQKLVTMQAQQLCFHEAFMRIDDEHGNEVTAAVFLPMAVRNGQMVRLDRLNVDIIIKFLNTADGDLYPKVAVNLACESLLDTAFFTWLEKRLLLTHGLAARLMFELSEYSMQRYLDELLPCLQRLKAMGVQLIIDHVGEALVDCHYMETIAPYALKLHSSLIRNIDKDEANHQYIQGIVALSQQLGCLVFAEGIETPHEWEQLKKLGVFGGQGYVIEVPYGPITLH